MSWVLPRGAIEGGGGDTQEGLPLGTELDLCLATAGSEAPLPRCPPFGQALGSISRQSGLVSFIDTPVRERVHLKGDALDLLLHPIPQDGVRVLSASHDEEDWTGRPQAGESIVPRRPDVRVREVNLLHLTVTREVVAQHISGIEAEAFELSDNKDPPLVDVHELAEVDSQRGGGGHRWRRGARLHGSVETSSCALA